MSAGVGRMLFYRLSCAYAGFAMLIAVGMVLSKVYVSKGGEAEVAFVLRGLAVGYALIFIMLCVFTYARLCAPINRAMKAVNEDERTPVLWSRMTRFPHELRYAYLVVAFAVTFFYRLTEWGLPPWSGEAGRELFKGVLFDLSTFLAFALLHEAAARWILLPYIRSLRIYGQTPSPFYSAIRTLMLIAGCSIVYVQIRLYGHAYSSLRAEDTPHPAVLLAIGAVVFALAALAVWVASSLLFRDLDRMTDRFRKGIVRPRQQLLDRLPVASAYEPGELAAAFNKVQERFAREYARLDKELQLAERLQQQLLPAREGMIGQWCLFAVCERSGDVGGSFCDWMETEDGRIVLAVGRVAGDGPPSALIMSAVLLLLRSDLRREALAGEKLAELAADLSGILTEELHLHIAIAILDPVRHHLQWAVSGEAAVAIEQDGDGRMEFVAASAEASLPLGLLHSGLYETRAKTVLRQGSRVSLSITSVLQPGERVVVTAVRERGEPDGRIL